MGRQMSLNIGGATVDTNTIKSIKWAKGVNELDTDVNKGDDVILTIRCRVTGGGADDKYDAHGNIKETIKGLVLRADDLLEFKLDTPGAYKAKSESEDDAIGGEAASQAAKAAANGTGPAEPAAEEPAGEPAAAPAGDKHLASV